MTEMIALPTGERMRPTEALDATYMSDDLTLHILDMGDGKLRAFTTWGSLMAVGDSAYFTHDQTRRDLGHGTCVTTRHPGGATEGEPLPAKKIPHWVAK
ncbi:MAG TPA: hypothetical protein VMW08_00385 [Acidimicrobiales bacterium]|nr:hypothetical protein [Acidimicrobiales bacterium]